MASRFKFKILSENPQEQYDNINPKDPYTFYLLTTGVGYLGEVPLFGGGAQNTVVKLSESLVNPEQGKLYILSNVTYESNTLTGLYFYDGNSMSCFSEELISKYLTDILTTDMTGENYTGDDSTIATTKAIVDLLNKRLGDSDLINVAFFRKIVNHTITQEDMNNPNISLPTDTQVGDIGLLVTADNDGEDDGDEQYYFISLKEYLTKMYGSADSSSIKMELTEDNNFKATLKIKEEEKSLVVDEGGVYILKTDAINEKEASSDKLVTEKAILKYITDIVMPKVTGMIDEALEDVVMAEVELNKQVSMGGVVYPTLAQAIDASSTNSVITLTEDTESEGIYVTEGKSLTLDLNGKTLTMEGPYAGSAGTKTNGFQFLKNSNVTIKNGLIEAKDAKIVLQNYSNLTLDNVRIEGYHDNLYLLSNNFGNIVLKNGTTINAKNGMVAFDLYYGMSAVYDAGVTVTIEDESVIINGLVEYSKAARASEEDFAAKCRLTTPLGYSLDIPEGFIWVDNGDNTQTLKAI